MKRSTGAKPNNKGFSLVELIVCILMMGLISGMLVVFITMSRNDYRIVSDDTMLQDEASFAMNYISELSLEAESVTVGTEDAVSFELLSVDSEDGSIDSVSMSSDIYYAAFFGADNTSSSTADKAVYIVVWEKANNVLRFGKFKYDYNEADATHPLPDDSKLRLKAGTTTGELDYVKMLQDNGILGNNRKLLARYITDFDLSTSNINSKSLRTINFTVSYDGKDYVATKNIAGRNRAD